MTISIIIPTFNSSISIKSTIESVLKQTYIDIELIIVDGGSKDDTMKIINEYKDQIDFIISEPDNGLWDAMNKGVKLSKGEWVYFLGSDDILIDNDVLQNIVYKLNLEYDLIFGNIVYDNGSTYKSWFGWKTYVFNTVHHQSAFYNKKLFHNFNYDTNYSVSSDYELNFKIYYHKLNYLYIDWVIAKVCSSGISHRYNLLLLQIDFFLIRKKQTLNIIVNIIYSLLGTINALRRIIQKKCLIPLKPI